MAVAAAAAWVAVQPALLFDGGEAGDSLVQEAHEHEAGSAWLVASVLPGATEGDEQYPERYEPPVDAEVVDPFRPPAHVGAPGNRGLEYDPEPGQAVWASAPGQVVFAGTVVHNRFVTVLHADGLRTTYGYLGWIAVSEGDWVTTGQLVGTTSDRFFFSVRLGETYLDPALVLAAGRPRLVP